MPQKRERRAYESDLVDEFAHGVVRSPDGLVPGQNILLLLDWVASAVPAGAFSTRRRTRHPSTGLPTPFRCVATNAPSGRSRDLAQGRVRRSADALPEAERPDPVGVARSGRAWASSSPSRRCACPKRDGGFYRLVDGAAVDDFPTDVAIDAFHPDVLIGFRYKGIDKGDDTDASPAGRLRAAGDRYHPGAGGVPRRRRP